MDPITLSLLGVGAIGSIAGMFKKTPKTTVPTLDDLKRANPDLYNELQSIRSMSKEYERLYSQRTKGATAQEMNQVQDARSANQAQLSNRGLVGSSAGQQLAADFEGRMNNQIQDRLSQEQLALLGAQQQSKQAYLQAQQAALNPYMQAQQANNQAQMANDQAQNQFFGGLVNGGLGMYGTQMLADTYAPRGGGFNTFMPQTPAFQAPQFGASMPYQAPRYSLGVPGGF